MVRIKLDWRPAGCQMNRDGGPLVVGIDPSLTATGIAFPSGRTELVGVLGLTGMSWINRSIHLGVLVESIIEKVMGSDDGRPDLVVIEQLDLTQSYGGAQERVVLWWDLVRLLARRDIRVEVAASSIGKMYATGRGVGPKAAIIAAVQAQWPHFNLTSGQKGRPRLDDNLADAATYCALGMHLLGSPLSEVSEEQLRAVTRTKGLAHVPPKGKKAA